MEDEEFLEIAKGKIITKQIIFDCLAVFLYICAILAFVEGLGVLDKAKGAMHQVFGINHLIISAICFGSATIVLTINSLTSEIKKLRSPEVVQEAQPVAESPPPVEVVTQPEEEGEPKTGPEAELETEPKAEPVYVTSVESSFKLMEVLKEGKYSIAIKLIEQGADVNALGENGYTPSHYAASIGHTMFLKLLISKGANINAADYQGKTPLKTAMEKSKHEVADLLRNHGAKK